MATKTVCDICGEEMNKNHSPFWEITHFSLLRSKKLDVCPSCIRQIKDLVGIVNSSKNEQEAKV